MRAVRKSESVWRWRVLACATWAWAALLVYRARPTPKHEPSARAALPASSANERAAVSAAGTLTAFAAVAEVSKKSGGPELARRLSDAPEAELSRLAELLARAGGLEAHEVLFRAAGAARPALRAAARAAIATLDTADARAFMLEALNGDEPAAAVSYFADCLDPRAVAKLESLARSGDAELRQSAVSALLAQGDAGSRAIGRLLADDDAADTVLQASIPSTEAHRTLLAASIARLRRGAISSGPVFDFLARDFSSEGLNALADATRDEATAASAIDALQTRGDAAALSLLARIANNAPNANTDRAACALVASPDSRSRSYLVRTGEHLRREATTALLRIDAPEAAGFLARLRASANDADREAAAQLSSEYGPGT